MKVLRWLVLLSFIVIFGLQNIGCDRMPSPTAPSEISLQTNNDIAAKHKTPTFNFDFLQGFDVIKSWTSEKVISFTKGGWIGKRNAAFLYIRPESMSTGEDTEITSHVFLTSDNQLIFNFLPDDLSFDDPAKLILNYKLLVGKNKGKGGDVGSLVLKGWNPSNDEWEILGTSNSSDDDFKWEKSKWKVSFEIDHFSIYLISKD